MRVLRVAVGRRALQVGLLVGGLLVLGFLCGEQAQAADGIGALPGNAVTGLVKPAAKTGIVGAGADDPATALGASAAADTGVGPVARTRVGPAKGRALKPVVPVPGTAEPDDRRSGTSSARVPDLDTVTDTLTGALAQPADGRVLRPVTEDLVGAVGDQVVRPVGDLVETVTTGLVETVGISPSASLPELPTLPSFPQSPSWPTLPGVPIQTLPVPAPVTSVPGGHALMTSADEEGPVGGGAVYGPRFAGGDTVIKAVTHDSAHRATSSAAPAPGHQAPSNVPGGALGGKSAVDNGSSRHGDAHAVTLIHRALSRLVPGAAADVDTAGTRDRHRDIPVFPG